MAAMAGFRKPQYLVLGPGGVKGFYILGALDALDTRDYLSEVKGYAGSSIGALISLLMVAGYKPRQIMSMATQVDLFQDFYNVDFASKLADARSHFGIISTAAIRTALERALVDVYGQVPTLESLYLRTGLELWTVSYDLDRGKAVYFSHSTHPLMDAVTAVMLSINIPLMFYRVTYEGRTHIDGGFCDPLPLKPFDDGTKAILCIYVTTCRTLQECSESFLKQLTFYVHKIIMTGIEQLRGKIMEHASPGCQFLELRADSFDTVGVSLGIPERARMIVDGLQAGLQFLSSPPGFAVRLDESRTGKKDT